ncbi:MAG: cysteine methyltransferase [Flavobacteriaceae bacterium]|nr:cysteine methyltransferase [Flavobacteriaceae bacterium]
MENNSICFNSPVGYISAEANNTHVLSIRFANGPQINRESTVLLNLVQEQFSAYFNGTLTAFDLPLEFTGTDFQRKVWQHLLTIAFGQTCSYLDLALALGDAKAIRAVAAANAKNKHLIVIPCHRIISKSGKMQGYAGGIARKEQLLRHEKGLLQASLFSSGA